MGRATIGSSRSARLEGRWEFLNQLRYLTSPRQRIRPQLEFEHLLRVLCPFHTEQRPVLSVAHRRIGIELAVLVELRHSTPTRAGSSRGTNRCMIVHAVTYASPQTTKIGV
jgi:hypothetical protein